MWVLEWKREGVLDVRDSDDDVDDDELDWIGSSSWLLKGKGQSATLFPVVSFRPIGNSAGACSYRKSCQISVVICLTSRFCCNVPDTVIHLYPCCDVNGYAR